MNWGAKVKEYRETMLLTQKELAIILGVGVLEPSCGSGNFIDEIINKGINSRWELCIGLCRVFQIGLGIRVNNINWGHPQIRTKWRGQNHQFRVCLSDIPTDIDIYRLSYKNEEYHNLYKRKGIVYDPAVLCPVNKSVKKGDYIIINSSTNSVLNDSILDPRLRGVSVDVPRKKSMIVCKLIGCNQCDKHFNIKKI